MDFIDYEDDPIIGMYNYVTAFKPPRVKMHLKQTMEELGVKRERPTFKLSNTQNNMADQLELIL